MQVTVKESDGQVIFLRKVIEGGCDSSYGIHVAKMAGVPDAVVNRAWEILAELESHGMATAPQLRQTNGGASVAPPAPVAPAAPVALEKEQPRTPIKAAGRLPGPQLDMFGSAPVEIENPVHRKAYEELMRLDLDALTPMQLMMKIHELKVKMASATAPGTAAGTATSVSERF